MLVKLTPGAKVVVGGVVIGAFVGLFGTAGVVVAVEI